MATIDSARLTANVPVQRARDDIEGTLVSSIDSCLRLLTICRRWSYLQKNVDNVMNKLQDGLDMKTYM